MRVRQSIVVLAALAVAVGVQAACAQDVTVPDGFEVDVFADGLSGVRTLKVGPDGMLYAVLSRAGQVVRIDPGSPDRRDVVLEGLNRPYGLAFHDGWTYVGETDKVVRFRGPRLGQRQVVVDGIPTGGHWTRELAFGPDGMLYVSVGSSCNVCEERDERRAAVVRYAPDGSGETIVARGLRNAAGLAFHPETGELWASQNERDNLGEDLPLEEINILADGDDFGWPYCYGDGEANPEYPDRRSHCARTVPPALGLIAHSAPLGMVFYEGQQFPDAYRGDLFVALHGSWNRREKSGYKVVRVAVSDGRPTGYEDFAAGFVALNRASGRPTYPVVAPDGSLLFSDDQGGRIYRVRWIG